MNQEQINLRSKEIAKTFYLREEEDRGWKEYKEDEIENFKDILSHFPKDFEIIQITNSYNPKNKQLTLILHTDIPTNDYPVMELNKFTEELSGDSNHQVIEGGVDFVDIILIESY